MMYRCPYCGQPAFSLRIKLGIVSKFGVEPRCPHCKRLSRRRMNVCGNIDHYLFFAILAIIVPFCFAAAVNYQINWLIPLALLLFVLIYLLAQFFLFHFDKSSGKEQAEEAVFRFLSTTGERLWPTVRQGEIYEIQFPKQGARESGSPKAIGLIDSMKKTKDGRIFTVRIIKLEDMTEVYTGAELRLVTEGMLVVPGIVLKNERD